MSPLREWCLEERLRREAPPSPGAYVRSTECVVQAMFASEPKSDNLEHVKEGVSSLHLVLSVEIELARPAYADKRSVSSCPAAPICQQLRLCNAFSDAVVSDRRCKRSSLLQVILTRVLVSPIHSSTA